MKNCPVCNKGYISIRKYVEIEPEIVGRNPDTKALIFKDKVMDVLYEFCSNVMCNWFEKTRKFNRWKDENYITH